MKRKRIGIIAREPIKDFSTGRRHTDAVLRMLDGYWENIYEVNENYDSALFIEALKKRFPEMRNWEFETVDLDQR